MQFDQLSWVTNTREQQKYNFDNSSLLNVSKASIKKPKYSLNTLGVSSHVTKDVSVINILTHCQRCSSPLQQPSTLPCGYTVCNNCLLSTLTTYQCLSFSCLRSHKYDNLKPTVLLEKLLSANNNKEAIKSLLDCSICLQTLDDPTTTECGHTFCRQCLIRTMSITSKMTCPYCRHTLDKIGKTNQLICQWIDYYIDDSTPIIEETHASQHDIPLIQISEAVLLPTQHCVIHITCDRHSLLKNMIDHHHDQKNYAICVFTKPNSDDFYKYGIMVQINQVECSPDLHHSVIQAVGLFRLHINQISIDIDEFYTANIYRINDIVDDICSGLDSSDSSSGTEDESRMFSINTIPTTQSTPTSNIQNTSKTKRPRPSSMRLSSSLPISQSSGNSNTKIFVSDNVCPGSNSRKNWNFLYQKFPYQQSTNTLVESNNKPRYNSLPNSPPLINTMIPSEAMLNTRLHSHVLSYLEHLNDQTLLSQYSWYFQEDDRISLVWWIANVFPLEQSKKIELLSMQSLRERISSLICWFDTYI